MAQIFHPFTNTFSKASLWVLLIAATAIVLLLLDIYRSPYITNRGFIREQPVPFSHAHHVGGLGIDCRYCHASVEKSSFAGLPATEVCMTCHSQIWKDSPMLEPVRESWRMGKPLEWVRVHELPDYVYFDHSIHISKGVGCVSCHGRVDKMPLMLREKPLTMGWCLDCHRNPRDALRLSDKSDFMRHYDVTSMTNCTVCHQ